MLVHQRVIGNSTISMAISNRSVQLPEGKWILAHDENWNGIVSTGFLISWDLPNMIFPYHPFSMAPDS